ncbi:MAG TPA: hypothetical protein VL588_13205, partial [Bdellovibrionota bacterium]|nr:hypothetical protein [Bdellovibrionota bacterium]
MVRSFTLRLSAVLPVVFAAQAAFGGAALVDPGTVLTASDDPTAELNQVVADQRLGDAQPATAPVVDACAAQSHALGERFNSHDYQNYRHTAESMRYRTEQAHLAALAAARQIIEDDYDLRSRLNRFFNAVLEVGNPNLPDFGPAAVALSRATASEMQIAFQKPAVLTNLLNYSNEALTGSSQPHGPFAAADGTPTQIIDRIVVEPGVRGALFVRVYTSVNVASGQSILLASTSMTVTARPDGEIQVSDPGSLAVQQLSVNGFDFSRDLTREQFVASLSTP